jgi:hypothetical protein
MSEIYFSARLTLTTRAVASPLSNKVPEVISYRVRANDDLSTPLTSIINKLVGENMKKFSVLVALALLAVAGTGFAVTCAYDNVPGATLLVPYFRVGGTVDATGRITSVGTDTKIAFVNVSQPGIIAHVTVWNKYSAAVLDFNVPMTGKDVVTFNMSSVLNGSLSVNPTTQIYQPVPPNYGAGDATTPKDVCGVVLGAPTTFAPTAWIGWGQTQYLRFAHPRYTVDNVDWPFSVSRYGTGDAFSSFRIQVMSSLDESGDITELQSSTGAFILDTQNPACTLGSVPGSYTQSGEFSGYLTIDVVNYCTNWFPSQDEFYSWDAIATTGWGVYGYTPNVLIGDVFYVDNLSGPVGNVSGDPAVALEFDTRLNWVVPTTPQGTFFGRFVANADVGERSGGTARGTVPAQFRFGGDGREPLGDRYGVRYMANPSQLTRTWLLVWRGDRYTFSGVDLCYWLRNGGQKGDGFYDANHAMTWITYDEDENTYTQTQGGGPSGGQFQPPPPLYIFLETQRIALANVSGAGVLTGNTQAIPGWGQALASGQLNPGNNWYGGWMDLLFRATTYNSIYNQAWVGVQHSGPGVTLGVGHAATNLNGNFQCNPAINFANGVGVQVN